MCYCVFTEVIFSSLYKDIYYNLVFLIWIECLIKHKTWNNLVSFLIFELMFLTFKFSLYVWHNFFGFILYQINKNSVMKFELFKLFLHLLWFVFERVCRVFTGILILILIFYVSMAFGSILTWIFLLKVRLSS